VSIAHSTHNTSWRTSDSRCLNLIRYNAKESPQAHFCVSSVFYSVFIGFWVGFKASRPTEFFVLTDL
jgi:hypothetical protein